MADYGYMDVTATCPTHGSATETVRIFGKHGDTVYKVIKDSTNGDYYTLKVVLTISGSVTSYVHD